MRNLKYNDYINSDEWKNLSGSYLKDNPICQICNNYLAQEVHHMSYKNLGDEKVGDLQALCKRCHEGIHNFPPYIKDEIQLAKSIKIMKYFRDSPVLKTQVLNDVSRKYYNYEFMLDVTSRRSDNTALFFQNLLEMFYEDGEKMNEDIIEYTLERCIWYRINIKRMKIKKENEKKQRIERQKNNPIEIVNEKYESKEVSLSDEYESRIRRWILNMFLDRKVLANAKSHMNKKYYGGLVWFNEIGVVTSTQFLAKIKRDGFLYDLYKEMGGTIEDLKEKKE